nr:hypothetical protein [Brucella anthropi]
MAESRLELQTSAQNGELAKDKPNKLLREKMVGPEVLQISGFFNGLQKSGTEKYMLKTLCFIICLPHLSLM